MANEGFATTGTASFPLGPAIDVLRLIDVQKHAYVKEQLAGDATGPWLRERNAILSPADRTSLVFFDCRWLALTNTRWNWWLNAFPAAIPWGWCYTPLGDNSRSLSSVPAEGSVDSTSLMVRTKPRMERCMTNPVPLRENRTRYLQRSTSVACGCKSTGNRSSTGMVILHG